MTMSKDEKIAMRRTFFSDYRLSNAQRDALIEAGTFVLANGGPPEEIIKDLREALQVLTS